jgi:glycosyltransferase involved in cell wall biosynthesis
MKVTVITVVLNRAADLDVTIRSVIALKRNALDYIIIDGGSTDGTVDVIRSYADQLKYWRSEPDDGIYDAMNKGWALASLDSRLLFLGAGDRLISLPDDNQAGFCQRDVLFGDVKLDGGQVFHPCTGLRLRLYNTLHHQALLVPKILHPAPPFDLAFPRYADFDLNQRLSRLGVRLRYAKGLSAYAAPDGLTGDLHLTELTSVVLKNYGPFWSGLSRAGFTLAKKLPLLRVFRPISDHR